MQTRSLCLALAVSAVAGVSTLAQISIRPGWYEQTTQMQLDEKSAPTEQKDFHCVTPQEAKDIVKVMVDQVTDGWPTAGGSPR
jgi:hypothetical protein